MATPKLKADIREESGKTNSKKLRNEGLVPGVLYGHNKETREVQIKTNELQKVLSQYGYGTMVSLEIKDNIIPAIIKEVQNDIVTNNLLHIDLQQLSENEKVKLSVPIVLKGKRDVEDSSTIVQQQLMELEIQCLPKYIPNSITVDAIKVKSGDALTVGDLDIIKDENIEVLNETEEVIASLTSNTTMDEEVEESEENFYESDKSVLDI